MGGESLRANNQTADGTGGQDEAGHRQAGRLAGWVRGPERTRDRPGSSQDNARDAEVGHKAGGTSRRGCRCVCVTLSPDLSLQVSSRSPPLPPQTSSLSPPSLDAVNGIPRNPSPLSTLLRYPRIVSPSPTACRSSPLSPFPFMSIFNKISLLFVFVFGYFWHFLLFERHRRNQ